MTVLVFGAAGQLGRSLQDTLPPGLEVAWLTRPECELADAAAVSACLARRRPSLIVNAAAWTAVDRAEQAPEAAHQVNALAVAPMAEYAAGSGARLLQISTDFVFDGAKRTPYTPDDRTNPLGVYGRSKLAGEAAALRLAPEHSMIIRTAWVYSEHGHNFVKTMLRLMRERDRLEVVDDQQGSPTYARGLAQVIWRVVTGKLFRPGLFHWADEGCVTWCGFARAIQAEALAAGLLTREIPVGAIASEQYPTPAQRPGYSVLDPGALASLIARPPAPWRDQLRRMLARIALA